jgi:polyferredoxin
MSAPFFYQLLADLVVGVHFVFVLFVILGGFLVVKWRRMMWLHVSAAFWGAVVEFCGWICPLTPLEIWFRRKAGEAGYHSDFVARYLLPVLYPEGLTRGIQIVLGVSVVAVNLAIYGWVLRSTNMERKV